MTRILEPLFSSAGIENADRDDQGGEGMGQGDEFSKVYNIGLVFRPIEVYHHMLTLQKSDHQVQDV